MAVAFVGVGSSIFHPEASRMAYVASGGKRAWPQIGVPTGRECRLRAGSAAGRIDHRAIGAGHRISLFSLLPLIAMVVLWRVGKWYLRMMAMRTHRRHASPKVARASRPRRSR